MPKTEERLKEALEQQETLTKENEPSAGKPVRGHRVSQVSGTFPIMPTC
jgi:hypothetical protein